uniref:C2H2-type domain-containing protein n=1 Tax=Strix occidentalis caurina TaxID=311401 RepID=A0A8D0ESN7_STROC
PLCPPRPDLLGTIGGCWSRVKKGDGWMEDRWLLFMSLKSPQLSPFGLPTGAGTDKQKEEQCQPREEQRGMLQGPEEEPQSPTVDVEHDGQQQPDDTQGSPGTRIPQKCSFKGTCAENPQEATTQPWSNSRGKKYKCEHCGKVFRYGSNLTHHRQIHMGEKPYKCWDCGKSFTDRGSVLHHRRTHTKERPYLCTTLLECGECFSHSSSLSTHRRTHTGEKPSSCSDCGESFTQKQTLILHQQIHPGEMPNRCQQCQENLPDQLPPHHAPADPCTGELPRVPVLREVIQRGHWPDDTQGSHRPRRPRKSSFKGTYAEDCQEASTDPWSSSREKKYKCEHCEKVFVCRSKLIYHLRTHTGEKPYKCWDCGRGFSMRGNLLSHQRTHTKEKPFPCPTCGKYFSFRSNLFVHQRIHTRERPYTCSYCGKTFREGHHLRNHQDSIHNGESSEGLNPVSHRAHP